MALILIIDDDPAILRMMTRILRSAGHDPITAADGRDGLKVVAERGPDLVITDIIMPGMEGIETIIELRRVAPTIKILAMSGSHNTGLVDFLDAARKLGADSTLHKPFQKAELLEAVRAILG
jgi:DNA-binding response OmpR family regulator